MGLENFAPEIWHARILSALQMKLVFAQPGVINRDYEGDIQAYGDTVRITSVGDPTVGDYSKNTNITDPESLTSAQSILMITQTKYVNFQVDDIDKAQANTNILDEASMRSAYVLAKTADTYLAGLYTDIDTNNALGSDSSPYQVGLDTTNDKNAYQVLVDLSVVLDEANVPEDGRWVIVPPWYHGLLLKDERFVKFGTPPQDYRLQNGIVGRAAGFDILKSNNVQSTGGAKYKIMAGHPFAWSYAEQLNQVIAYRPEKRFADAVKALHLYGGKVVRSAGLALLTANKGTL